MIEMWQIQDLAELNILNSTIRFYARCKLVSKTLVILNQPTLKFFNSGFDHISLQYEKFQTKSVWVTHGSCNFLGSLKGTSIILTAVILDNHQIYPQKDTTSIPIIFIGKSPPRIQPNRTFGGRMDCDVLVNLHSEKACLTSPVFNLSRNTQTKYVESLEFSNLDVHSVTKHFFLRSSEPKLKAYLAQWYYTPSQ